MQLFLDQFESKKKVDVEKESSAAGCGSKFQWQ